MSFTMTRTASESFTLTHAKYLASKVTADMLRCQQNYGRPAQDDINNYGTELALLLRDGYVAAYEFGFSHDDQRLLSWHYVVDSSGISSTDDRPGRIVSGVAVASATWFNQLTFSSAWFALPQAERDRIRGGLPIQRVTKDSPKDGLGYWTSDLSYSANGISLGRRTFRPF
jgi:HORMA domain-containing protein